jgi:hypothetical protein
VLEAALYELIPTLPMEMIRIMVAYKQFVTLHVCDAALRGRFDVSLFCGLWCWISVKNTTSGFFTDVTWPFAKRDTDVFVEGMDDAELSSAHAKFEFDCIRCALGEWVNTQIRRDDHFG